MKIVGLPKTEHGSPYSPSDEEWPGLYDMLCGHCARQSECIVVDSMIEMKEGAPWPTGGWVHDDGARVSCLSYEAKPAAMLSREELLKLAQTPVSDMPPVCGGCAARKGTEASKSRHTRKDFQSAVKNKTRFVCHETKKDCGGWCRAIASSLST